MTFAISGFQDRRLKPLGHPSEMRAIVTAQPLPVPAAERTVEAGYRLKWSYENDSDLAAIRDSARFKALLGKLRSSLLPRRPSWVWD